MTRSAFIVLTGRPNVGKSTLLNALVGEKVAIVSKKPQTTRNRITGVWTDGEDQYVFLDTPGLHKPKNLLGEYMMKAVGNANSDADAVLFVVDASEHPNKAELAALDAYAKSGTRTVLVINKIDVTRKEELFPYVAEMSEKYSFASVVPVSALNGDGLDILRQEIKPFLFESPHFFPDDVSTDQPERRIAAEVIREKILRLADDEVPHGIAVVIEDFKESKGLLSIRAEIYCERQAHKRILIGKDGAMLKKIGTYAREDLETMLGARIYLDLWVKVKENWRDRPDLLNSFGYNPKDE